MEGKTVKQAGNNKGCVFLYQGKPMKHVVTAFKTACNRAGIPYGRNTPNGLFTTCDIASVSGAAGIWKYQNHTAANEA
jgi:hypothetical protein